MVLFRTLKLLISSSLLSSALVLSAHAGTVTCGDSYRTASLSSADLCYSQTLGSTAKAADVKAITGSTWSLVSGLDGSGTDGWLSVSASGWGKASASGSWSISDLFWDNFSSALITMHVGGGQKDAVDNFEWLITPETLAGVFNYAKQAGKGGGLSNIKLWGMGTVLKPEPPIPPVVPNNPPKLVHLPEPNALMLFVVGVLGLILIRRKRPQ